jgi:hypothetical protein
MSRSERKATGIPLAREEWDFEKLISQHRLTNDQIYFCMTYEFAREVPSIVKLFQDDEEYHRLAEESCPWHHIVSYELGDTNEYVLEVIDAPRGFPDEPYFKVFRNHVITRANFDPLSNDLAVCNFQKGHPEANKHTLHIDWNASPQNLINDFKIWVSQNRPAGKRPIERRGKSALVRNLSLLKKLGAYRLMRAMGGPQKLVDAFSRAGSGFTPPYRDVKEWSNAKKEVAALINEWSR